MSPELFIWSFIVIAFILSSYFVDGHTSKAIATGEKIAVTAGALFIALYYDNFLSMVIYIVAYAVIALICKRPLLRQKTRQ